MAETLGAGRRPAPSPPPSCAPANASAAILETRALTVTAGGRTILRDVNLSVAARGVFGIIGPSGAGKSTLLRCLNRLVELDSEPRRRGRRALSRPIDLSRRHRHRLAARSRGNALPAARGLPEEHSPQRRLRYPPSAPPPPPRVARSVRAGAARSRPLGRGEGPPSSARAATLGWPAAAPVPGPHAGDLARDHPHGRTHQRPRSQIDRGHRRISSSASRSNTPSCSSPTTSPRRDASPTGSLASVSKTAPAASSNPPAATPSSKARGARQSSTI